MKTVFTSLLALAAAASFPTFADTEKSKFSFNPNESVAEIYVDLAEAAETICEAEYKNSAIRSVWGTAIANCERELLNKVVAEIGNPQLADLHNDGTVSAGQSLAEAEASN
ncbi:MAG: hypothetical protein AAGJ84_10125 [Pseudomonadota bacterium]